MVYVETGSKDIYFNLAAEYYFAVEKRLDEAVYLLWSTTPTLVVGKFQNALEEIDRNYAEEKGISVVRRLSGGGTMYLDEGGLQFTFIEPSSGIGIQFEQYILPIVKAIQKMGIAADFTGRNDLVVAGKKFSGNSQYKAKSVTVHHGTMMFDTDIEEMMRATTVDKEKLTSNSVKSVRERVTNLKQHLPKGREMSFEQFKWHMITAVAGDPPQIYYVSQEDKERIEAIADEKLRGYDNIYGRSPKFTMRNKMRLPAGKVEVGLVVDKGVIVDCKIMGDFFSHYDIADIERIFIGRRYHPTDVMQAIDALPEDAIHRLGREELLELITK